MFSLAIFIGIYSYILFFLGVTGLLYKNIIMWVTLLCLFFAVVYYYKKRNVFKKFSFPKKNLDTSSFVFIFLVFLQVVVNFIGVLGPEISFDALWYHLTLPKIFLENNSIFHIPGGLLYYSDMPKLTETLFIAALSLSNEISAKFIHFLFGIATLVVIYKLSIKFLSIKYALLAVLIFYSNLVVGWESITAYVDLSRTFFELLAFYAFILWTENKKTYLLLTSSIMLGFAVSVKLVAAFDLLVFLALFAVFFRKYLRQFIYFAFITILIPMPWLFFSFINTGNPVYPYLSLPVDSGQIFSIADISSFLNFSDPISPIYIILIPIIFRNRNKINKTFQIILTYSLFSFLIWFLTQSDRGFRFLLSYLSVFSVFCAYIIYLFKNKSIEKYLVLMVVFIAVTSIGYRFLANVKYIPYIFGKESKNHFLTNNLNFNFGDFYDTDGYFKNNIKNNDKVLLYGFHNLYYVNFPYIHSTWVKKGDKFNFIAVQNADIPKRFSDWKPIYYNNSTKTKLYTKEFKTWIY